jgi:hypothetical protein
VHEGSGVQPREEQGSVGGEGITTRKLRFRESGSTLTKYGFTLTKMIRDEQPSHISSHSIKIRKIQFAGE